MKKPLIGVVPLWDEEKQSLWMLPGYMDGVTAAGGLPVMLPLNDDPTIVLQAVRTMDGFLFTGGQDVSPALYHQTPLPQCGPPCPLRDVMERALFEKIVFQYDKPVFGICRGIQLFNVLLGGTLYQDIPSQVQGENRLTHQQLPPYGQFSHDVLIGKDSPLYELLNKETLAVNSCHHQGIDVLAAMLSPMATATDGLIEAAYIPNKKFVWAVQWHPELLLEDTPSQKLFHAFVQSCR